MLLLFSLPLVFINLDRCFTFFFTFELRFVVEQATVGVANVNKMDIKKNYNLSNFFTY